MPKSSGAVLLALFVFGCGNDSIAGTGVVQAIVGFEDSIDAQLISSLDAEIIDSFPEPPTLRIAIGASQVAELERAESVAFVQVLASSSDSAIVFLTFADRPNGTTPVSEADYAAVESVGGYIKYVYTLVSEVAAVLPITRLSELGSNPAIATLVVVEGRVYPQD